MKRSEIKDLYNQSDSALRLLKCMALILPYCNGEQATAEATQKAAAQAAALWNPVKVMCDYMIDDGSIDMTERLQNIKAEVSQIELSVAKMGYSKEQMPLLLNCRAIINQIKDMEAWTANNLQPHHEELPEDLNTDEAKGYLQRLVDHKFCDINYHWNKDKTKYQATQAAHHISFLLWGSNKWKPFETLWRFNNMAGIYNKMFQANDDSIKEIDGLFPENAPPTITKFK